MPSLFTKSSPNIKPESSEMNVNNIFHLFYQEQCKSLKQTPVNFWKNQKSENTLEVIADKITPEEWMLIFNALNFDTSLIAIAVKTRVQYKFLPDIDSEDKIRHMKRRVGSIFTTYIMKGLLRSISKRLQRNKGLFSLEFDGVPINIENIDELLVGLKKNTSLVSLTIKHCSLRDLGCQVLCNVLGPNIEAINLSSCSLGAASAQYLSELLKLQKLNNLAGLQRINLSNNSNIGDVGLMYLLEELWVKALIMQRCGITEYITPEIIDSIACNKSLMIADFRNNENLSPQTLDAISDILRSRPCDENKHLRKSASATNQNLGSSIDPSFDKSTGNLRRSNTFCVINYNNGELKENYCNANIHIDGSFIFDDFGSSCSSLSLISRNEYLMIKEEIRKERALRIQKEAENKKLSEEIARLKNFLAARRVVKYNALPINEKKCRVKSKSRKKKKRAGEVEFVFEDDQNNVVDLLKNLVTQEKVHADEVYYRSLMQVSNEDGDQTEEDLNSSDSSLIKFMREIKGEMDVDDDGDSDSCGFNK